MVPTEHLLVIIVSLNWTKMFGCGVIIIKTAVNPAHDFPSKSDNNDLLGSRF